MVDERSLHPLDETLMHQTSRSFHYAGTSDHRFFDRYWFAGMHPQGEVGFVSGLAFYKNMGVCDGFLCIQRGDWQYNARFSRALDEDRTTASVGGLTVMVDEPFRRISVSLDGSGTPLSAALTYTADREPSCEAHYTDSSNGRVNQQVTRYHQPGRWSGWLDHGEGRIEVGDWWGTRDHSWGVRPGVGGFDRSVADPRAAEAATPATRPAAMAHTVMVLEHDDLWVYLSRREDDQGRPTYDDAEAVTRDGRHLRVAMQDLSITFPEGSRQYEQVRARLVVSGGAELDVTARPLGRPWAYSGTGYDGGYSDGRGLGAWRGTVSEFDVYEYDGNDRVQLDGEQVSPGHREQLAVISVDDGSRRTEGTGYCAVMTRGALPRYGLP